MATTTADVPTEAEFFDLVESALQPTLGFRQAFRDGGEQQGPDVSVGAPPSDMFSTDDYKEVPENAEYPRADPEGFERVKATLHKRGFESVVTDEAVARNQVQQALDIAENQARTQGKALDAVAGSLLLANLNATTVTLDTADTLTWEDLLEARTHLRAADYTPDLVLIEPYGAADLLGDERSRAPESTQVRNGNLPSMLGMNFAELTVGSPAVPEHGAVMIDSSRYGYEFTEDLGDYDRRYRDESRDRTVFKIRDSRTWLVSDADAGMQIGGS